jgi:predicted ester cyclase
MSKATTTLTEAHARHLLETFCKATSEGPLELLDQIVVEDYVQHQPGVPQGLSGLKSFFSANMGGITESKGWFEHLTFGGDRIAAVMCLEGTHSGLFMGMPGTGKRIRIGSADFFRVRDGKLGEHWAVVDGLEMMRQFGMDEGE